MSRYELHTLKYATISCTTSGDNTLVAAVSGKRIVPVHICILASAAVNAYFHDSAGTPVALIGDGTNKLVFSSTTTMGLDTSDPDGITCTTVSTGLVLNLSGTVSCAGFITYYEV